MILVTPSQNLIWGRLVKSWATGLNYLDCINTPPTATDVIPSKLAYQPKMSKAAFNAVIEEVALNHLPNGTAGFTVTLPDSIQSVNFVQTTIDTLEINLPPADGIASADLAFTVGSDYDVPDFEKILYGLEPTAVPANPPTTPADIMTLTANFIGRYTLANCRR